MAGLAAILYLIAGALVVSAETSGAVATPAASPIAGPVYETVISNADIVAIEPLLSDLGDTVARFTITHKASAPLAAYTKDHIGEPMPIVLDGVVLLAPIINETIAASFSLQAVELKATQRLVVYGASPPYPAPLTMTGFLDLRPSS